MALLLDGARPALAFPPRSAHRGTLQQLDREGRTLTLATHELSEIIPAITRVALMKEGRIVADGPKDEIFTESLLSDVYGMPVYVDRRDGLFTAWC